MMHSKYHYDINTKNYKIIQLYIEINIYMYTHFLIFSSCFLAYFFKSWKCYLL